MSPMEKMLSNELSCCTKRSVGSLAPKHSLHKVPEIPQNRKTYWKTIASWMLSVGNLRRCRGIFTLSPLCSFSGKGRAVSYLNPGCPTAKFLFLNLLGTI
jgi:hypothetical protein